MSSGSGKKEPRYTCLIETKASNSQNNVGKNFFLCSYTVDYPTALVCEDVSSGYYVQ
jgi:hypothetical protein